ncbi:MAG: S1/P1 nuclease [Luminiphilus sp.]|nr:S1/P1 nuclease [Luminiphilus sp.]
MFRASTVAILAMSSPVHAWWDSGHQQICDLAMVQVQPATRAAIANLLDSPLGEHCSWADQIKGQRPETRTWHYLNALPETRHISTVPRPEKGDVISALIEQTYRLKHDTASQRREALLWVGHLVGDLHQPLHLGYASDLGGNTYRLTLSDNLAAQLNEKRKTVSMHAVWDGLILRYPEETREAATLTTTEASAVVQPEVAILAWADETLAILNDPGVHYRHGSRLEALSSRYLISNRPVVEGQIQRAAARLAALLDWAFSSQR